ncbi:nucleoside-diphosphate sugar epimerase [Lysinibacillus yapensis]|uniref:Nucleoside-diphosphate sugar epimerase n=1 Tax=Ureibacillus yapensis TaxID=2304605 RepID=A0A396S8W6_9BACL|nr:nucleoside-diphosphate sugar epimerase [Lysinibacillus yapensis]RHW37539.1 nucleoside-diphosphate sugar epimerase [Lysinibacillus yapensis]
MLKIKKIDFIKTVYDDSLSHNIFSIANIQFSNYPPINGALLYWKKNTSQSDFTPEGDYKFFYDMANITYYASVKFPKNIKLTRDQRQELAYILLDERGSIGTYSLKTHPSRKRKFSPRKALEKLSIPENFDVKSIPSYVGPIIDEIDMNQLLEWNPSISKKFIHDYCFWRYNLVKLHPSEFEAFLPYVDFAYVCYACDQLTEQYLIEHLELVDVASLQYNYPVLSRLSASFKTYIVNELKKQNAKINKHFEEEIQLFIEDETYFSEYSTIHLLDDEEMEEEEEIVDYQFFEFDRGQYKWPGSEHMIKGIPSFASQIYDDMGYRKRTNKEMDEHFAQYTHEQIRLMSAILEPHWLHRYRDKIDWQAACQYNEYLTEEFLAAHLSYINFEALGDNLWCGLSEDFIEKYLKHFNHNKPVPIIIRHLTEELYLNYKDMIKVDSDLLFQYYDAIGDEQYERLQELLSQ